VSYSHFWVSKSHCVCKLHSACRNNTKRVEITLSAFFGTLVLPLPPPPPCIHAWVSKMNVKKDIIFSILYYSPQMQKHNHANECIKSPACIQKIPERHSTIPMNPKWFRWLNSTSEEKKSFPEVVMRIFCKLRF
jgi:hypothetical protein